MEIFNPALCASMKRCRRRRQYQRLNDEKNGRRGHWRLPKIRVKVMMPKLQQYKKKNSPVKLLTRYRDAYVKMMLTFAGRFVQLNNGNVFFFKRISRASNFLQLGRTPVHFSSTSFKLN